MRHYLAALALCILSSLLSQASAAPIVVNGNLSDWGFTVADNNLSTFVPAANIGLAGIVVEDQNDLAPLSAFVGPGYGGQTSDTECVAVAVQNGVMYIAISTGQRPGNGFSYFGPGDVKITTSNGSVYGIEVGGGAGGGAGTALTLGAPGSTYTLDAMALTTAHTSLAAQTVGSVWLNPTWIASPLYPTKLPQFTGGTKVGDASAFVYTRNSSTTQHAVIEMSVPLSIFGGNPITSVYWDPACGNNGLLVKNLSIVPEPSSVALAAVGGVALLFAGWRRRRR